MRTRQMWLFADEIIWERNGAGQFAPMLRQGIGALGGKGAAALASAIGAMTEAGNLLQAIGRARWGPTGVLAIMMPDGTFRDVYAPQDREVTVNEGNKVRSEYVPNLVAEARIYGLAAPDDIGAYPPDRLRGFYDKVLQLRKALFQDAAQYGLGPNPALPEPDRYIRLAEAVIQARAAAPPAVVAPPTPAYVPAPPPPSIAAPAAPPPELLAVGPARFVAPREPRVEEYMAAEREGLPVRPRAPLALVPSVRPWWQTPPAIIGGVLLLFGGAYILVRAGRR